MRWLLTAVLPAVASLMATFANAEERKLYEWTVYTSPSEGTVNEVYVGDKLLEHGHGEWKDCLTPRRNLRRKQGLSEGRYRAAFPICKDQPQDKVYQPSYDNTWAYGSPTARNGVQLSENKGKYKLCQRVSGIRSYCVNDLSADDLEIGESFLYSADSIQQTIEYSGKNGDTLSFLYAEFSGGFAREAFNRTFTIDLSGGNVMAYKGAVIEILEATNAQVKYRVVRAFPTTLTLQP